uniref:Wu:fj29h11 n=1 Tax=Hucho hucho TaxID=62062 RepID=A0A4W5LEP3_9TELE
MALYSLYIGHRVSFGTYTSPTVQWNVGGRLGVTLAFNWTDQMSISFSLLSPLFTLSFLSLLPCSITLPLFPPPSSSSSVGEAQQMVGILGEVSQTQALSCLLSCPLLDELGQWSQWELVFRPHHGPLKDFIDRNAASTDLSALEVSPGVLLRVTTCTGDKLFSQAAMTLDPVGTAGHLVSMVVADGTANAPTALLANHMESSLAAAVAKEDLSRAEEDGSCFSSVALFLLDCLTRIPTRTCRALLQQVSVQATGCV